MEKHKNKATTVRFNAKDKENIERIKALYACTSDIAAIRVALQLAATQERAFHPHS